MLFLLPIIYKFKGIKVDRHIAQARPPKAKTTHQKYTSDAFMKHRAAIKCKKDLDSGSSYKDDDSDLIAALTRSDDPMDTLTSKIGLMSLESIPVSNPDGSSASLEIESFKTPTEENTTPLAVAENITIVSVGTHHDLEN